MIIENLNFFSLIIPSFLIVIGLCVICFNAIKTLPKYITWHAVATVCIGLCILLHSILTHSIMAYSIALVLGIFLLASIFITHAVHHRLNIETHWGNIIFVALVGFCLLFYFSAIQDNQDIRHLILGVTISSIFGNRIYELWSLKPRLYVDRGLKYVVCFIVVIAVIRGMILFMIMDNNSLVSDSENIWATTQLLLILLDLIFFALFTGCALQDQIRKLRIERNIDPLTGLLNRRALNERINALNDSITIKNALLLCDLDYFKKINDTYGHPIGDEALKHVSAIMSKSIRPYDEISRIGGEEFVIVLKDVNHDMALNIGERIRKAIEAQPLIINEQTIPITVSIGMDFFDNRIQFDHTMEAADLLLYQAKKMGRNQIQWHLIP